MKSPHRKLEESKVALRNFISEVIRLQLSEAPVRKHMDIPLPEDLLAISAMFKAAGKDFYLVGGSVRDALMGKEPKDLDVATNAVPDEVIAILRQNPDFTILEIGKSFGVIKVVTPEKNEYEIATLRKDIGGGRRPQGVEFTNIEQDAQRRDLTINALFYDIERKEIIDYVSGIEDIARGTVRTVGDPVARFDEDRLRILRALRFAGRFGTNLDGATAEAIRANNSLAGVSPERIRDEFLKGVKSSKSLRHFYGMVSDHGLWEQVFPGLRVNSEDVHETKNVPVQLALLLRDNDPRHLMKALNGLKYSAEEVAQVSFLVLFQGLSVQTAYRLKKLFANAKLKDSDLIEYARALGSPEKKLVMAFLEFRPSIGGEELQGQGFSGKELGQEMERRETELFASLL